MSVNGCAHSLEVFNFVSMALHFLLPQLLRCHDFGILAEKVFITFSIFNLSVLYWCVKFKNHVDDYCGCMIFV